MRTHRLTLLAVVAVFAASIVIPTATASADDGAGVTWSLAPATADGVDGRSWAEIDAAPGDDMVEHAELRNFGDAPVTFSITAADGYFTEKGRFNMLPSDGTSTGAGTWIDVTSSVTVEARASVVFSYVVHVPANATPGDHAAGIAASVIQQGEDQNGSTVGVESRVGFRVITTVSGAVTPDLRVRDVSSAYLVEWNPLSPGMLAITYLVENSGNVQLRVSDSLAGEPGADRGDLLPGESRTVRVEVPAWPLFFAVTELGVHGTAVNVEGDDVSAKETIVSWTVPWPQLAVLAGVALLLWAGLAGRRRSRDRVSALISEARESGRREAQIEQLPVGGKS